MDNNQLKTGTTTVALLCKDGIVLAADKRVTSGYLISNKKFEKIFPITGSIAVTEAVNLLAMFVYGNIRKYSIIPGVSHFIVAGKDSEGFHGYDIAPDGSIIEIDDYTSSGSGSVMAYGVLETLYKPNMSIEEGVKLAVKAINAAVQRDIASGNGVDVLTVTKDGIKKAFSQTLTYKLEA